MAWKKVERAVAKLPPYLVVVRKASSPVLEFPTLAAKKVGIDKYHSADVYLDEKSPTLMALQLYENGDGEYRIGHREDRALVHATNALRRVGAQAGLRYRWRQDTDGFLIIDFSKPILRKDWGRMHLWG